MTKSLTEGTAPYLLAMSTLEREAPEPSRAIYFCTLCHAATDRVVWVDDCMLCRECASCMTSAANDPRS